MYKKSLSYPHLVWMTIFVVAPMLIIFLYAFTISDIDGHLTFSLKNFIKFFDPMFLKTFAISIYISFLSVAGCILLGYPAAYILAKKDRNRVAKGKKPTGMLLLFIMPMWMNVMLKLYSWLAILNPGGILSMLTNFLGLGSLDIMNTYTAVVLVTVYDYIPFMILPIYSVLIKLDNNVIEAAQDLGANPVSVFTKVTLPLSVPGILSGITMVFLPALTSFYIFDMFGGTGALIGNVIEGSFQQELGRNFGSAISIILMLFAFLSMYLMKLFGKSNRQMSKF